MEDRCLTVSNIRSVGIWVHVGSKVTNQVQRCALIRIHSNSEHVFIRNHGIIQDQHVAADLHTGMYGEVCPLVAQGNVVSHQLSSGCVVSQLEPTIPSIVHEHTGPSEDRACHLKVHISVDV